MTTPRVTVPVEDLAGKLKAIRDKFLMPTPDKDFTDYAIMTRCIEALSAAPAPEGVAVGLNDRAAELMRQCTDPERFEGVSTLNVYANMRAWLSDLPPAPGAEDE